MTILAVGVRLSDILVVDSRDELRKSYDRDTGKVLETYRTTQYIYRICGREMPIAVKQYPTDIFGSNRRYGWDMQENFEIWASEHGFAEELYSVEHSGHEDRPVRHPRGVLGLIAYDLWDDTPGAAVKVSQDEVEQQREKATKLLREIGYDGPVDLFLM